MEPQNTVISWVRGRNAVVLRYILLGGDHSVDLELQPLFALRGIHELMYQWNGNLGAEGKETQHRLPPAARTPEVFFAHTGTFLAETLP